MTGKLLEEDIVASYFKISKSAVDLDLSKSLHRYWEIMDLDLLNIQLPSKLIDYAA